MASEKTKGVYYHDQPGTDLPAYTVTLHEARKMRDDGKGFFINNGTAFRLYTKRPLDLADVEHSHRMLPGGVYRSSWSAITFQKFSEVNTQLEAIEHKRLNDFAKQSPYLCVTTEQMA